MEKLATIYAQSLFSLALETDESEKIMEHSAFVLDVLGENPEFVKLLGAPVVSTGEKTDAVDKVFSGSINKTLLNFIKVMAERKDTSVLADSLREYENLYNRHFGIEKAVAVTAVPMSKEMQQKLREKLEGITGKKIVLTNKVDETCLGGVILQLGDIQTDGSVSTKLSELRKQLKSINR